MINPYRSLILLGYVFLFLGLLMFIFPDETKFSLGTQDDSSHVYTFNYFNYKEVFFPKKKDSVPDIKVVEDLVAQLELLEDEEEVKPKEFIDNNADPLDVDVVKTKKVDISHLLDAKYRIQFPDSSYDALAKFFTVLSQTNDSSELIRIIHYGDSQLEGDRITHDLRKKFQKRFGGCGFGMIPIIDNVNARSTIKQEYPEGWHKYLIYGTEYEKEYKHNYGLLGSYFGYDVVGDSAYVDSTIADSVQPHFDSLWVKYTKPFSYMRKYVRFDGLKLLYGDIPDSTEIVLEAPDTSMSIYIPPSKGFGVRKIDYAGDPSFEELTLKFRAHKSPQLYGLCFDCNGGIAVDNVGMRGSSGIEFLRIDKEFFSRELIKMNARLLILQYGVNVVPGELEDYSWYERKMYTRIRRLKSLNPNMDILVVGVSDMSKKEGEEMISYPNVKLIRDAQKNAAQKAGVAFWDLYEAMGGENSMVAWVEAEEPLAGSDYTHFNSRGARMVASMLYNALMLEYEQYLEGIREK